MKVVLCVFAALVVVVGCGGGGASQTPELTDDERGVVLAFRSSAAMAGGALDGLGDLDPEDFWAKADAMVALAREKGDADFEGRTVRDVLIGATAEFDLGPEIGARITDALTAEPG